MRKFIVLLSFFGTLAISFSAHSKCTSADIKAAAKKAVKAFNRETGVLYGVRTWTARTKYKDQPGYNSCARVVTAILNKAGCGFKVTDSVNNLARQMKARGWEQVSWPQGGDVVIWNSNFVSNWLVERRYAATDDPSRKVAFRHTGVALNFARTTDNKSGKSRPGFGWMVRVQYDFPFVYRPN